MPDALFEIVVGLGLVIRRTFHLLDRLLLFGGNGHLVSGHLGDLDPSGLEDRLLGVAVQRNKDISHVSIKMDQPSNVPIPSGLG